MAVRPRPRQRTIGIGVETVYGTLAQPTIWIPGECDIKSPVPFKESEYAQGELDETRVELDNPKYEGTLKLECAPGCMTEILSLLTLLAGETCLYGSVTIHEGLGNGEWRVTTGVAAKKFTVNGTKTERFLVDVDVVAQMRKDSAALTSFSAPTPDYTDAAAPYIWKEFAAKLATATEPHLRSFKLEIDHQLADDGPMSDGSGLIAHPASNGRKVTLTLDHLYEHKDLYTAAMAGTELAWSFVCQRGTDLLTLAFPRTQIMDGADPDRADTKQALQLKALKPEGAALFTIEETTAGS